MKRSLIWTATGAIVIGFGVPAYAAVQTSKPQPSITTIVTPATQPTTAATAATTQPSVSIDDSTQNSVDDNGVDGTVNSVDDNGTDATVNSVDDNGTDNSVDATTNTVEDISGPCDEAEHANDPLCAGAAAPGTSVDDNPSSNDGADDNGHHGGGDDSGHGGSDD